MSGTTTVDEFSCTALLLEGILGQHVVSVGTGFTVSSGPNIFLITNWHNVTGVNPETGKQLFSAPNQLKIWWHDSSNLGSWKATFVPIVDRNGQPVWKEHAEFRSKVDVIALPVAIPPTQTSFHLNERATVQNMLLGVGLDIFILGFPFGIMAGGLLPIWKRGSIASEPQIDIDNLPKMYADTASRPGMSGSPVIARSISSFATEDGSTNIGSGNFTRVIGVYSGRIGAGDELKAQLGIVWKYRVVDEILAAGVSGSHRPYSA